MLLGEAQNISFIPCTLQLLPVANPLYANSHQYCTRCMRNGCAPASPMVLRQAMFTHVSLLTIVMPLELTCMPVRLAAAEVLHLCCDKRF